MGVETFRRESDSKQGEMACRAEKHQVLARGLGRAKAEPDPKLKALIAEITLAVADVDRVQVNGGTKNLIDELIELTT